MKFNSEKLKRIAKKLSRNETSHYLPEDVLGRYARWLSKVAVAHPQRFNQLIAKMVRRGKISLHKSVTKKEEEAIKKLLPVADVG